MKLKQITSLTLATLAFGLCIAFGFTPSSQFKNGDIIFQSSGSRQARAIELATNSEFSHVGIVYVTDNGTFIYEAVQPVKLTPINQWIQRGEEDYYEVKRLKNADELLTPEVLQQMKAEGEKHIGKNYDLYFNWSDERMYCSELVWKIYNEALGIELGELQKLSEFNLSDPIVQIKLKERYGDDIPYDEKVISPEAIYSSPLLTAVEIDL